MTVDTYFPMYSVTKTLVGIACAYDIGGETSPAN